MSCSSFLEDEEQLDLVVNYLKEIHSEIDTKNLHQINGDGIKFILDVLLPEVSKHETLRKVNVKASKQR